MTGRPAIKDERRRAQDVAREAASGAITNGGLMKIAARALLLIGMLFIVACSSIPQNELNAYTSAFNQARASGEAIVLDFEAAVAEQTRREAARQPSGARAAAPAPIIPLTYTPPQTGAAAPGAIKVRLLAWEAIGEYNTVLAALNAGESVESIKTNTGRLVTVIGKLATAAGGAFPGGEALVVAAKEIAARLEMARLAAEFKRAVAGGTPIIRKMVTVFVDDTKSHYSLRASLAAADYARVAFERDSSAREQEAKRARIKAAVDEFRTSLDNYVRLLEQVDRSLDALQAAVDRPIDFAAEANRIVDIAIDLRQHWVAYQNARN